MSVTPRGRLSSLQPEAARAVPVPAAAARARAREPSTARIVIDLRSQPLTAPARPANSRPGRRLVDAADQALEPQRESPPLLFGEKAPELAAVTVRLDGEPARVL